MDTYAVYITIGAAVIGFLTAALAGKPIIGRLRRLHCEQTIREDGPTWHNAKGKVPTMGGVLFIGGTLLALLLAIAAALILKVPVFGTVSRTVSLLSGAVLALLCGVIGFADDYIKVVKKRNLGLTALQKLVLQLLSSGAYAVMMYLFVGSEVQVPFIGTVDFGLWYIPFCVFVVVAMSNATNLTDGVDGLCGTVSFVVTGLFLLLCSAGQFFGLSMLSAAFAGGLAGFLVWNLHPAKVFMGDTGSLFIGGMLCAFAFGIGHPFLLVPAGIIYIFENLSVILQVGYFKLTHGKRLFKMSPLHHHFEKCGWSETTIVTVFTAVTAVGCIGAWALWNYC